MNSLHAETKLPLTIAAMRSLMQDLRFGMRLIWTSPGFAVVAVLTLALGISSATTVFTWIDSLLIHPFPGASRSDDLSVLEMSMPSAPNGGTMMSWTDYTDFRDRLTLLSGLAVHRSCSFTLGEGDGSQLVWGELVSPNYFEVLGIQPVFGRMFGRTPDSDTPGASPVAVISERLWRSSFHADRSLIGKTVRINRRELTIVGVAPARFRGTTPAWVLDVWVPATMSAELGLQGRTAFSDRGYRDFDGMIARRKPGITNERAQDEVAALAASLARAYPKTNRDVGARISPPWAVKNGVNDILLSPLRILLAVSMVLLLIVCANVANLLLARSVARHREFAIRLAMGASRWRLSRQLMTETMLLAIAAAAVTVLALPWMSGALVSLVPSVGLPLGTQFEIDVRALGFIGFCCLAGTVVAGCAPAYCTFRSNLNEVLKDDGRGSQGGRSTRARSVLVILEVALASVALIGAALFGRSFYNVRAIHPGFDTQNVLFARFFMESTGYPGEQEFQLTQRLRQTLESSAMFRGVACSDFTPLSSTAGPYEGVQPEGYVPAVGESLNTNRALVSPGYFRVLNIPVLQGRDFTERDDRAAPPVMIVNQTFAARYFRSANPVGRKVRLFGKPVTIVGMAADSKYFSPIESPRPYFYVPFRQFYRGSREVYFVMKTARDPAQAIPSFRRAVLATDPNASAFHAVSLAEYTQVSTFSQKVAASLMGTLGLMCLLLAALGLYGVMSYSVRQRTPEIGIRMAMGARPADVVAMVVREGMTLTLAGLALGIVAALAVTRVVTSMLINVDAADPVAFASAAGFLALVALLATWLPARRATRIDPMHAIQRQ